MKKKKLDLESLKVQSFVTNFPNDNQKTVKGGISYDPNVSGCDMCFDVTVTGCTFITCAGPENGCP
ncbi:MAG: pinensin family lanthipeptide [Bacteroidota bacterium]